jgi:uncharacterized protein (DUF362 family)
MSAAAEGFESVVAFARSARADYGSLVAPLDAAEIPSGRIQSIAHGAIRELLRVWGLDAGRFGKSSWNPLGEFIEPGARVVLKPNWVLHWNQSGEGLDSLLTHSSVIEAALEYVALARPGSVVIGDAPLQGCDFRALREACGLDAIVERFRARGLDVSLCDFRRTILLGRNLGEQRAENCRGMERFVLFDLGRQSLLEALAEDAEKFRVTMYNPDLLRRTHAAGRHQYLIAREVIEADVVLNLPKLKCHKKAGITGALKNLIGINGNKEYLPHHRKGGGGEGGDCYSGSSWLKRGAEDLLDVANRRGPGAVQTLLGRSAAAALRAAVRLGADDNLEGSWHGNDTIWRTCLDLQRILAYGREDGMLCSRPQRRVLSITDAIVGGEGDGPLAPTPVPSGFVTGAANPAAAEWVNARLMGLDPEKIPLIRNAFERFSLPLTHFAASAIRVRTDSGEHAAADVGPPVRPFRPSEGWRGHCELSPHGPSTREQAVVA